VIMIGSVAAIVMAPLASVPSGPFRLDRVGVLAASFAFVWCGWYLLRHATLPGSNRPMTPAETAIGLGPDQTTIAETKRAL
jgi:membrane protein implicated in regulation of membrane protease activity